MNIDSASQVFLNNTEIIRIIKNGATIWEKVAPDYFYIQNEYNGTNTFTLRKAGTPASSDLAYSKNKTNWTSFNLSQSTNTVTLNSGEKLYLRSSTGFSSSLSDYFGISCSQNYSVGGNIMTLINYTNASTNNTVPNYSFYELFYGQSNLKNANNLNFGEAKTLNYMSLRECFYNTSITMGPSLNKITTVGERAMENCFTGSSIVSAPNMPSVTSIGDWGMSGCYTNCQLMTTASDLSNVTSVGERGLNSCYSKCHSLVNIYNYNKLTTINENAFSYCYKECDRLIYTPSFSNVTSVGNSGLKECFSNCTLIQNAPNFKKVTSVGSEGFYKCYYLCNSLLNAYAPSVSSWDTDKFYSWLYASENGVLYKPSSLSIPTNDYSGIPYGWTTQNY